METEYQAGRTYTKGEKGRTFLAVVVDVTNLFVTFLAEDNCAENANGEVFLESDAVVRGGLGEGGLISWALDFISRSDKQ